MEYKNPEFQCKRCGDCCTEVRIPIKRTGAIDKYTLQWYKARGIKIVGNHLVIPSTCPQLIYETYQGNLIATCTIQANKPLICAKGKCLYL